MHKQTDTLDKYIVPLTNSRTVREVIVSLICVVKG